MDQKILLAEQKFFLRNKFLAKKLPSIFIFSNRRRISNFSSMINSLPKRSAIVIREYDLVSKKRQEFALKYSAKIRQKNLSLSVGKDIELSIKLKAEGFHFSDFDKVPITMLKKIKGKKIISFACHNLQSLKKANKSPLSYYVDLVFLSPVFHTISHTQLKELGLIKLRKFSISNKKPLYALGGVNEKNVNSLTKIKQLAGFAGIGLAK